MPHQPFAQQRQRMDAHIDRHRRTRARQRGEVQPESSVHGVTGGQRDHPALVSMRQRHGRIRGTGESGGNAWDDLEWHAGGGQRLDFLAAAAEDQRVAAFQPHHAPAIACQADQERVDILLLHAVVRARLADKDAFGIAPAHIQHFFAHQAVVHDDIGFAE